MSYQKETDPLLPQDKPAPEIHGSRASSINDVTVPEVELEDEVPRLRRRSESLIWITLSFMGLLTIAVLLTPNDFFDAMFGNEWSRPKTIDQRVNRILADTPLIGRFPPRQPELPLTSSRWPY